jgi:hypothetical protein
LNKLTLTVKKSTVLGEKMKKFYGVPKRPITIRIPEDLNGAISKIAEENRTTKTHVIVRGLEFCLKNTEMNSILGGQ